MVKFIVGLMYFYCLLKQPHFHLSLETHLIKPVCQLPPHEAYWDCEELLKSTVGCGVISEGRDHSLTPPLRLVHWQETQIA